MERKQRLELNWIGKDDRPRLEPRILVECPEKSYFSPDEDSSSKNILIYGDNLMALKAMENSFSGKVKCVYIDPPFNTKQAMDY